MSTMMRSLQSSRTLKVSMFVDNTEVGLVVQDGIGDHIAGITVSRSELLDALDAVDKTVSTEAILRTHAETLEQVTNELNAAHEVELVEAVSKAHAYPESLADWEEELMRAGTYTDDDRDFWQTQVQAGHTLLGFWAWLDKRAADLELSMAQIDQRLADEAKNTRPEYAYTTEQIAEKVSQSHHVVTTRMIVHDAALRAAELARQVNE